MHYPSFLFHSYSRPYFCWLDLPGLALISMAGFGILWPGIRGTGVCFWGGLIKLIGRERGQAGLGIDGRTAEHLVAGQQNGASEITSHDQFAI